jgi:hypothetical protein
MRGRLTGFLRGPKGSRLVTLRSRVNEIHREGYGFEFLNSWKKFEHSRTSRSLWPLIVERRVSGEILDTGI